MNEEGIPTETLYRAIPRWAEGCPNCKNGITFEHSALQEWGSIYLRRAAGWKLKTEDGYMVMATQFCNCKAGKHQESYARQMWQTHGSEQILKNAKASIDNWSQNNGD